MSITKELFIKTIEAVYDNFDDAKGFNINNDIREDSIHIWNSLYDIELDIQCDNDINKILNEAKRVKDAKNKMKKASDLVMSVFVKNELDVYTHPNEHLADRIKVKSIIPAHSKTNEFYLVKSGKNIDCFNTHDLLDVADTERDVTVKDFVKEVIEQFPLRCGCCNGTGIDEYDGEECCDKEQIAINKKVAIELREIKC